MSEKIQGTKRILEKRLALRARQVTTEAIMFKVRLLLGVGVREMNTNPNHI